MIVYLDVVFIENIIMNYIILLATSIISKQKIKIIEALLSSSIGGLYAVLNYILPMNVLENLLFKIFLSLLMIKIAFYNLKLKKFLICLLMFYLTSLTFGGAAFMLLFLIEPKNIIYNNGILVGTYPIKIALLGGILGFVIIFIVSKILKNRFNSSNLLCELEIFYEGKSEKLKTLVDTGNLLKEPISKLDVIIVEKSYLKKFIDDNVMREMKNIISGKFLGNVNNDIYKYRFKLIPFASLGNENGVLIGFKPDYIKLYYCEDVVVKKDVFIGIYDGKLSNGNYYSSLVGINIFEEGIVNEYSTIS